MTHNTMRDLHRPISFLLALAMLLFPVFASSRNNSAAAAPVPFQEVIVEDLDPVPLDLDDLAIEEFQQMNAQVFEAVFGEPADPDQYAQ